MGRVNNEVRIDYTHDGRSFAVVMKSHDLSQDIDVFSEAAKHPNLKDKTGEQLVAAILPCLAGKIWKVTRCIDGKTNDGPNGEPAVQMFKYNGMLLAARHYKDGCPHDGPNGEPAFQDFISDTGTLTHAMRCKNYDLNDGPNGEAAIQSFNMKGALIEAQYYKNGKRNDGLNGELATQIFDDDGTLLTRAESWKDGVLMKELNADERAAYQHEQRQSKQTGTTRTTFWRLIRGLVPR